MNPNLKKRGLKTLAALIFTAGAIAVPTISSPVEATADVYSCPTGTVHHYKIDGLSGFTFTVPTPPNDWTILAVILKVGGGGNGADVHHTYTNVNPGDVITRTGQHAISHAHICKGRVTDDTTTTTTTTTLPPPDDDGGTTTTTTTTTTTLPPNEETTTTTVPPCEDDDPNTGICGPIDPCENIECPPTPPIEHPCTTGFLYDGVCHPTGNGCDILPADPTCTVPPVPAAPQTPPTPPSAAPTLPSTGSENWVMAGIALSALLAGGGFLLLARRN